jgi:hypothetical protein
MPNPLVEMQIFSGRENPTWQLPEKIFLLIEKKIATISFLKKITKVESRLGFTGFLILSEKEKWHIYKEKITIYKDDTIFQKKDTDRNIEKLIFATANKELQEMLANEFK